MYVIATYIFKLSVSVHHAANITSHIKFVTIHKTLIKLNPTWLVSCRIVSCRSTVFNFAPTANNIIRKLLNVQTRHCVEFSSENSENQPMKLVRNEYFHSVGELLTNRNRTFSQPCTGRAGAYYTPSDQVFVYFEFPLYKYIHTYTFGFVSSQNTDFRGG